MKDKDLILRSIESIHIARERSREEFSYISDRHLNWKSNPDSWSIAQCLDHLIVANGLYYSMFDKLSKGEYRATAWASVSPLSGLFGLMFRKQLSENPDRKMKTSPIFYPSASAIDKGILVRFDENLSELSDYFSSFSEVDLDKTILTSPAFAFITYSLRDVVTFLTTHVYRHIGQAIRVKEMLPEKVS